MEDRSKRFARIVTRRGPCFPFRNQRYFDCTPWGGGFVSGVGVRGGVVIDDTKGLLLDLSTGEVRADARFAKEDRT
jgi:hypothetical protein